MCVFFAECTGLKRAVSCMHSCTNEYDEQIHTENLQWNVLLIHQRNGAGERQHDMVMTGWGTVTSCASFNINSNSLLLKADHEFNT